MRQLLPTTVIELPLPVKPIDVRVAFVHVGAALAAGATKAAEIVLRPTTIKQSERNFVSRSTSRGVNPVAPATQNLMPSVYWTSSPRGVRKSYGV